MKLKKRDRRFSVMGQAPDDTTPTDVVVTPVVVEPTGDPAPEPTTPETPSPTPKMFDETYVQELRRESAAHRTKNKELTEALDAINREKMSEQERLQADLQKFTTEIVPTLERTNRTLSVQVAAAKAGIVDPEAAALMLDWDSVANGTSVEDALTALVAARPWLKSTTTPVQTPTTPTTPVTPTTPSTTSPANPSTNGEKKIWKLSEINSMNNADAARYNDEIIQALVEGRIDREK